MEDNKSLYPTQQEPPESFDYSGGISTSHSQDETNLVRETNPNRSVEEFEHELKREAFDSNTGLWVRVKDKNGKILPPMINEIGFHSLMSKVKSIVNQHTTFSNIQDINDVRRITIRIGDELDLLLIERQTEFEVTDSDMTTIVNGVTDMVFMALMRCYKEGDKKFFRPILKSVESIRPSGSGSSFEKKSWLDKANIFK